MEIQVTGSFTSKLSSHPFDSRKRYMDNGRIISEYHSNDFTVMEINGVVCIARVLFNDNWLYIDEFQLCGILDFGFCTIQTPWNKKHSTATYTRAIFASKLN